MSTISPPSVNFWAEEENVKKSGRRITLLLTFCVVFTGTLSGQRWLWAEVVQNPPGASTVAALSCVECHKKITPSIVSDWQLSKHSQNGIECSVCHGDDHRSAQDVDKVQIPTPETGASGHEKQFKEFSGGKHAVAWAAMKAMPTAHYQPMAMMEGMKGCGGCHKVGLKTAAEIKEIRGYGAGFGVASCDACHTRH